MTVSATIEETGRVDSTYLADGKLVQLSGILGDAQLPAMRLALLMPLALEYRDVVVDAGDVCAISDDAVAVLVAAEQWATANGVRFMLSRRSRALEQVLTELDLMDALPLLSELSANGWKRERSLTLAPVPPQRATTD